MEAFSAYYPLVVDFVVAIAEPLYRAHLIHHYKIHKYSLYGGMGLPITQLILAVSIGLTGDMIVSHLERISKNVLSQTLKSFISGCCERSGASLAIADTKIRPSEDCASEGRLFHRID